MTAENYWNAISNDLERLVAAFNNSSIDKSALSRAEKKLIVDLINNFATKKAIGFFGERYIAGHSFGQGIEAIASNYSAENPIFRKYSTADILGESAKIKEQADRYLNAYIQFIDLLEQRFGNEKPSSISLKASAICVVDEHGKFSEETNFEERLEKIVKHAHDKGIDVTLDMEDHNLTDSSLNAAKYIWNKGYGNFGIVLQSCLNRTQDDITKLFTAADYPIPKNKTRVRVVRGIYEEPGNIATTNIEEAKARIVDRVKQLFDVQVYVEIGTHDPKIVDMIINEVIVPNKISSDRFEFQFLKGVPQAERKEKELLEKGYKVRYYMPVEIEKGDGTPYMGRRLVESPRVLYYGLKNLIESSLNFLKAK